MAKPDFHQLLASRTIVNDGGMGTQLIAAGMQVGECSEKWNLDHADSVRAIHQRYADAGCDLLTTNSFGGSRRSLVNHGLDGQVDALNRKAAELAGEAAENQWVMGNVGPFGDFLEPVGLTTEPELHDIFTEQIHALKAGGADGINVETMSDPGEIRVAIQAAREVNHRWPIMASFAFQKNGDSFVTMMGATVDATIQTAIDAGATVVGANCGTDLSLDDYVILAEQMVRAAGEHPVVLSPNAGAPQMQNGEAVYLEGPDDFAAYAPKFIDAGVRVLGGCCGTTPAHLAAVAKVVKS